MSDEKSQKKYTAEDVRKNAPAIETAITAYMEKNKISAGDYVIREPVKGSFFNAGKDATRPRFLARQMKIICDPMHVYIPLGEVEQAEAQAPVIVAHFLNEGRLPNESWYTGSASKELMRDLRAVINRAEAEAKPSAAPSDSIVAGAGR